MIIRTIQSAFGQTTAPAAALSVSLPNPTTVGNTLSLYLRFSPLTGTPSVADNFGNRYRLVGVAQLSEALATSWWAAEITRGGAGHTITASSQGGLQTLEMGVCEQSLLGPTKHDRHTAEDILLAVLFELSQQTDLLKRLDKAERA